MGLHEDVLARADVDVLEGEDGSLGLLPREGVGAQAHLVGDLGLWGSGQTLHGLVLGCIEAKFAGKYSLEKLSPRSTQCTPLNRFGIHIRKLGKKGLGQNNPEKGRKLENERPLSSAQQAT